MKICTASQMREIDKAAWEIGGIPSIVLMENAAIACVSEIEKLKVSRVGIFCGKGNNGGDGLAIARHLFNKGYDVEVFLVLGSEFSGDALTNYDILEKTGAKITELSNAQDLMYCIMAKDLIVDSIFGTGIRGGIDGIARDVICAINGYGRKIMSVDIPSGVNSDTGSVSGEAVKADITVTFGAYKRGMFLYPGADYVGKIVISDISIPQYIIKNQNVELELIDEKLVKDKMPVRSGNSHKGDFGKILITGGSVGMTGAVALSSDAALFSGAGLVTAGIPKSLNNILEVKLTEAMTLPLSEEEGALSYDALEEILKKAAQSDILLFGVGAGRRDSVSKLLEGILTHSKIPVIVDADGLYALSENIEMLSSCNCNLIFTPHEMEFARLTGRSLDMVQENRLELSKEFAIENGVTLVLKGHHTIVTAPDGRQYVNSTGNSGMATGGSGDVLSGMIAAFAGLGIDETDAAILAVYLHGLAGDIAAERLGETSVTAGGILDCIKDAISYISTGNCE